MRRLTALFILYSLLIWMPLPRSAELGAGGPGLPEGEVSELPPESARNLEALLSESIARREIPGAVLVVGQRGRLRYRRAFGDRAVEPRREAMTTDTIFDMASLTKVVATTTAVLRLVEAGKIRLGDPVVKYIPEFKSDGKDKITVRQLLTHYSGLRPDVDFQTPWTGRQTALEMVWAEVPVAPPDEKFIYSDINFIVLGELVARVSGQPLDRLVRQEIFEPLGMHHTTFSPPAEWRLRIAPTEKINATWFRKKTGENYWLRGEVHDPTAYRMGGVAGHAGLFSSADDLAIFAEMLLNLGEYRGVRVLSPMSVRAMTSPQSPPGKPDVRGYGWDIASGFSAPRGDLFPVGSYGHTGWTGTSIWIDPSTQTYVILLTNRVHPDGKGDATPLRAKLANVVAAALRDVTYATPYQSYLPLTYAKPATSAVVTAAVRTGIDVLKEEKFERLRGRRVGLITNHTGRDREGNSTVDLLRQAPGVRLVALFSPEHGFQGAVDEEVASSVDSQTGLPIYSLYGKTKASRRPSPEQLKGVDVLVFDIQDVGARFYTYTTTMAYAMEAAAEQKIDFIVLDRPNPIGGKRVEGPVLDKDRLSFIGYFPMPVRHGMTMGEMARMFNEENHIGARLQVVKLADWRRSLWYDATSLPWINPSPNMRSLTEAALYPGVGTLEGTNLSVGRGTDTPFEVVGAPYIDGVRLATYLNKRAIPGVRFVPIRFTPESSKFKGKACGGINITIIDRAALDSVRVGLEIAAALRKLYPQQWEIDLYVKLIGSGAVLDALKRGVDPKVIQSNWQADLDRFQKVQQKYLLYP
jgi:uncharacterized protein YbbC (DUF1343 family)/CubicO group peptidase (beta-lactamase class C family)